MKLITCLILLSISTYTAPPKDISTEKDYSWLANFSGKELNEYFELGLLDPYKKYDKKDTILEKLIKQVNLEAVNDIIAWYPMWKISSIKEPQKLLFSILINNKQMHDQELEERIKSLSKLLANPPLDAEKCIFVLKKRYHSLNALFEFLEAIIERGSIECASIFLDYCYCDPELRLNDASLHGLLNKLTCSRDKKFVKVIKPKLKKLRDGPSENTCILI